MPDLKDETQEIKPEAVMKTASDFTEPSQRFLASLLKMYKFSNDPTTVAFAAQFACEAYKQGHADGAREALEANPRPYDIESVPTENGRAWLIR
jgi:hypothetical protein